MERKTSQVQDMWDPTKERMGSIAYKLKFPTEFQGLHDIFHASSIKKKNWEVVTNDLSVESILFQPIFSYE